MRNFFFKIITQFEILKKIDSMVMDFSMMENIAIIMGSWKHLLFTMILIRYCTLQVLSSGGNLPLISQSPTSSASRQEGWDMYVENPRGVDSHMPTVSMN